MYLRAKKAPKTRKDKNNNKNLKFFISNPNINFNLQTKYGEFLSKVTDFFIIH